MELIEGFSDQVGWRIALASAFFLVTGRWYFKRTNGGGFVVFFVGAVMLNGAFYAYPTFQLAAWVTIPIIWMLEKRNAAKKAVYTPAIASVEGGGVKRGLTAPEVSILFGSPLSKTVLMIAFGLLQKRVLKVEIASPLRVVIDKKFHVKDRSLDAEERRRMRLAAAAQSNLVLLPYEDLLLELLEGRIGSTIAEIDYKIMIVPLVQKLGERVGGYDLDESRRYYRDIVRRAPKETRMDGMLVSNLEQVLERNFLWILLDEDFEKLFDAEEITFVPEWLSGFLPAGMSFGAWCTGIFTEMRKKESTDEFSFKTKRDLDELSAKLISDVTRATFYS